MLVGPVGVILLLTLLPIRVPFWMSSDPPGTRLKPCMFYITEDIGAVDFCHGRIFRMAMNQRYTASPLFRALFWYLTLLWGVACVAFVPLTLAVVLTATFRFAYGFVLGFFFLYLVAVGLVSWALIALFRSKEWQWLQSRKFEMEAEGTAVNIDAGREPATLERMSSLARHTSLPAPKFISSNQPASLSTPPPVVHRRSDPV